LGIILKCAKLKGYKTKEKAFLKEGSDTLVLKLGDYFKMCQTQNYGFEKRKLHKKVDNPP